jgi:MFS family permease
VKSAIAGIALRAAALVLLGVFVYFFAGAWLVLPAMLAYGLAAGIAYAVYYTASNTMVFNSLSPRRNGSTLGVYSALAGAATMLGSFASGFLSFYLGFHVTFIVAAVCLVISAWLLYLTENTKVSVNLSTHELTA